MDLDTSQDRAQTQGDKQHTQHTEQSITMLDKAPAASLHHT